MSSLTNFDALMSANVREDNYVNATALCKEFEYRLQRWKELPETKAKIKAFNSTNKLAQNVSIKAVIVTGKGRGATTWLHPVMAVHLAQYLSPEFANFVAETFKRYLEADPTLADDIIQRQTDPDKAKWIAQRAKTKEARLKQTNALQAHGVQPGFQYAACTNATYRPILGGDAKQVRELRGIAKKDNLRDNLSEIELAAIEFAEKLSEHKIVTNNVQGFKPCLQVCSETARKVAEII